MRIASINWATIDGALWVLKFYRPARWSDAQIDEEHAFTHELAAAELPVAAPIERDGASLFEHQRLRFAAFPYLAGRAPELDDNATLTLLGRTLARIHAIGNRARFQHRPALTLERLGDRAREQVMDSGFVPEALEEQYARVSEQVIGRIRQCLDNFGPLPGLRIHGDCHAGNILWRENGPLFVDLDDCMSGPRIQDLWMFLSGDAASQQSSWAAIMEGYELFGEFDFAELTLVEALRVPAHPASRGMDRHALERSGVPPRLSLVWRCALLGAAHRRPVRAAQRPWMIRPFFRDRLAR